MGTRTLFVVALLGALSAAILLRGDGEKAIRQADSTAPVNRALEGAPGRILPGSVTAVDWLAALGIDPERCVALPIQAERWSSIRHAHGPWANRPRYRDLTSEVALGFEPDLVLVSAFSSAAAVKRIRLSDAVVMQVPEPATWEGLVQAGRDLAKAVGAEAEGEELIAALESRRSALASREGASLRVLPYANFGGGGSTSGVGTTLDLALNLAGFVNVAAEAGIKGSGNLTFEQILTMRFDAVLVLGDDDMESSESADLLVGAGALASVAPIQQRRFIILTEALHASGSPVILDAAEEIARQGDEL